MLLVIVQRFNFHYIEQLQPSFNTNNSPVPACAPEVPRDLSTGSTSRLIYRKKLATYVPEVLRDLCTGNTSRPIYRQYLATYLPQFNRYCRQDARFFISKTLHSSRWFSDVRFRVYLRIGITTKPRGLSENTHPARWTPQLWCLSNCPSYYHCSSVKSFAVSNHVEVKV
jgi:hypothetical protein